MPRIHTVLVANRGEIARRVFRTCRDLGLGTVAVYSEADRGSPHVREADRAVCIGPAEASQSYLDPARILDAARRTGADAIHPGYGFLAENAGFAQAVLDAGLVWIGPPPEAMRALGDKAAARKTAEACEVPTVPGYDGSDQRDEAFVEQAERIGYPVLVKASAGGGGRGMRRVDTPQDLVPALESARREAKSAFGNDFLLLERYVLQPRHVEVQVIGDAHGTVLHLFERECSIQRRHQKIVEEAPSPVVDAELREALGSAAVKVAKAADYANAGTVEFLVDAERRFYLLEMNARLQVEHPVTEAVTGLDLVALQIAVAEGRPLPIAQGDVKLRGHAIEVRLTAEDPNRDYLPATGRLVRFDVPADADGLRIDTGFETGGEVSPYYDSMLAKLIAWGPDRATANQRLRRLVERAWVPGVVTNLPLLREILAHPAWQAGELHTGFLGEHGLPSAPPLNLERGAIAATVVAWAERRDRWPDHREVPSGWRIEGTATSKDTWQSGTEQVEVAWRALGGDRLQVQTAAKHEITVLARDGDRVRVELDGVAQTWRLARAHDGPIGDGEVVYVHLGDGESVVQLVPRFPAPGIAADPGTCAATTPGKVVAVRVMEGERVDKGQVLVVLEAMKMEHRLVAPEAGVVAQIRVQPGDQVEQGAVLIRIEPES